MKRWPPRCKNFRPAVNSSKRWKVAQKPAFPRTLPVRRSSCGWSRRARALGAPYTSPLARARVAPRVRSCDRRLQMLWLVPAGARGTALGARTAGDLTSSHLPLRGKAERGGTTTGQRARRRPAPGCCACFRSRSCWPLGARLPPRLRRSSQRAAPLQPQRARCRRTWLSSRRLSGARTMTSGGWYVLTL